MPAAAPEKRKAQIRRQATALFQGRGFAATSMRELAATLGVEAASLYSHIGSKQQLLHEICFRLADEFFAAIDAAERSASSPADVLRRFIGGHVQVLLADPAAAQVFLTEWRHLEEPALTEFTARRDEYEARVRALLRRGADEGAIQLPANDERFAALWLLSGLNWLPGWYKSPGKLTPTDVAERLTATLLQGLGRGA